MSKKKDDGATAEKGRTALPLCFCSKTKTPVTLAATGERVAMLCPACDRAALDTILNGYGI